jgi:phosphohistidine phosphatase
MQLLIVRHGAAEDKADFAKTGKNDDLRPLTAEGKDIVADCAEGLREIVPEISELATSPLVRARETAEILARAYRIEISATTKVLSPDSPVEKFIEWIADRAKRDVVAIVGHEPHLSALTTWLMCGTEESRIELKKGGACLLTFRGAPKAAGSAMLEWLMHPKHLRALARR